MERDEVWMHLFVSGITPNQVGHSVEREMLEIDEAAIWTGSV